MPEVEYFIDGELPEYLAGLPWFEHDPFDGSADFTRMPPVTTGPLSDDHRASIGAALRGRVRPEAYKAKMRLAMTGKTHSDATKAKIALSQTGKKQSARTIEQRAEANRGQTRSAESRVRMSAQQLGKKRGPYRRKALNKSMHTTVGGIE